MYRESARTADLQCARCGTGLAKRDAFIDGEGAVLCRRCNAGALVAAGAADARKVSEGEPMQNLVEGVGFAFVLVMLAGLVAMVAALAVHGLVAAVVGGAVAYVAGAVVFACRRNRRWVTYGVVVGAVVVLGGVGAVFGLAR